MCEDCVCLRRDCSAICNSKREVPSFFTDDRGTVETDWAAILAGAALIIGTLVYAFLTGDGVIDEISGRMAVAERHAPEAQPTFIQ